MLTDLLSIMNVNDAFDIVPEFIHLIKPKTALSNSYKEYLYQAVSERDVFNYDGEDK